MGTTVGTRYPQEIDQQLRAMEPDDRQGFIRAAVAEKLAGQSSDLDRHIQAVINSLEPQEQGAAIALFEKLLERLKQP